KRPTKRDFFTRCAKNSAGFLPFGRPVYRARENRERAAMGDEEIEDVPAAPSGAPVQRDPRREPEAAAGKRQGREPDDSKSPPYSTGAKASAEPPPAAKPARGAGARGILGGAVAGLIVSALGLGAGYTLFAPKTDLSDTPNRLSALEAQARQTN